MESTKFCAPNNYYPAAATGKRSSYGVVIYIDGKERYLPAWPLPLPSLSKPHEYAFRVQTGLLLLIGGLNKTYPHQYSQE